MDKSFFDKVYDRKNTGSLNYDIPGYYKSEYKEIIPMWIADMDFKVPPKVEEELVKTASHGIFGYTDTDKDYDESVAAWYKNKMNFDVNPREIIKTPGVIFTISSAIRAFTNEGESVLICRPVYYPFTNIVKNNGRNLVVSNLVNVNGRYEIDFEDFEHKIKSENVKMFLLCSPHNPVGRVWTKAELEKTAEICLANNVIIVSDEIHSDFVFGQNRHIPIATLSKEVADITITCTSPTKTFNIAGLQAANIFVFNKEMREKLSASCFATGYGELNTMAIAATKTAYKYGGEWLSNLILYLEENIAILDNELKKTQGKISLIKPEGTYLMWLDCKNLGLNDSQLGRFFVEKAGVWMHKGITFGENGSGFVRMNIAAPKKVLNEALKRIVSAAENI